MKIQFPKFSIGKPGKKGVIVISLASIAILFIFLIVYFFLPKQRNTPIYSAESQLPGLNGSSSPNVFPTPAPPAPLENKSAAANDGAGLSKNEELVKPLVVASTDKSAPIAVDGNTKQTRSNGESKTTPTPLNWTEPTLGDLEKLRSENAMLSEQLKNAELKAKIAKEGGSIGMNGALNSRAQPGTAGGSENRGLRVLMIAGGENNYRANLLLPNGQSITASVGTSIPGYGSVTQVTPNEVILGAGKAKRSLVLINSGVNSDFSMAPQ